MAGGRRGRVTALLGLVLLGCTGRSESAERFSMSRVEWDLGDGALANGSTLSVHALVTFDLDTSAPPTGRDAQCGLRDGDLVVRVRPGPFPLPNVAEVDVSAPVITPVLEEQTCRAALEVVLSPRLPGVADLELVWDGRVHSTSVLEVRDPAGLFASLEGQQRLALVTGRRALLQVTRGDADGRPLRGAPLVLTGDAAVVTLEPVGLVDGWWVTALQPGPVHLGVEGQVSGLDLEAVAPEQLVDLRFFRLTVDAPCCGLLWQPIRWEHVLDPAGTQVSVLEPVTLVAAAVDASGGPVWVGANRLAYTVPQFPVVQVTGHDLHWGMVTASGQVETHGLEWLEVLPLRPGVASLEADLEGRHASLELTVR